MSDILRTLLDSHVRSKLLKLLYRNPDESYTFLEIVDKIQSKPKECRQELKRLQSIALIKKTRSRKLPTYFIDKSSPYFEMLHDFICSVGTIPVEELRKLVKSLGPVKLALASGIFISYPNARADLLIVADDVSKIKLKNFLKRAESETGKEIDFAIMDTDEYNYRRNMYDRFVLEMAEKPHVVLVDKVPAGKNTDKDINEKIQ